MEKLEDVFDCYDICRKKVFRGRKLLMCEAEDGALYGITESGLSEGRLNREYLVKQYLIQEGYCQVDQLCRNREGNFLTEDRYHSMYIVKHFFSGRELDVVSLAEVEEGAYNLACLHQYSQGMQPWLLEEEKKMREKLLQEEREENLEKEEWNLEKQELCTDSENACAYEDIMDAYKWMNALFIKRNRELKRIYSYMRKPGRKGEFVQAYNDCAGLFLKEGEETVAQLEAVKSDMEYPKGGISYGFCHGAYQHHNIIRLDDGWATIGMEQFHFGAQLEDLYDFLRKVLEKNNYDYAYAKAVLQGYNQRVELRYVEYLCLYLLLMYPEKFWKISNRYFNSKKTWVPPKMVEKLSNVVKQNQEKNNFLVKFREDYVVSAH